MSALLGDEEPVIVELAPNAEPRLFVWNRFVYEVIGQPQQFFERDAWWRQRSGMNRIDREFWKVEATPTGDATDATTYDLARRPDEEGWMLARAWE